VGERELLPREAALLVVLLAFALVSVLNITISLSRIAKSLDKIANQQQQEPPHDRD
jgi:hypothetical protein